MHAKIRFLTTIKFYKKSYCAVICFYHDWLKWNNVDPAYLGILRIKSNVQSRSLWSVTRRLGQAVNQSVVAVYLLLTRLNLRRTATWVRSAAVTVVMSRSWSCGSFISTYSRYICTQHKQAQLSSFTRHSCTGSYCWERVLAIAILSVRLPVRLGCHDPVPNLAQVR